jgi:predicted permease
MNLILQVLQTVAPVFILAGIGVVWVKLGWEYRVQFVTRLTMTLSVPALIFVSLMKTEIDPQALRDTALAAIVTYVGVGLLLLLMLKVLKLDLRTYLAPLSFGNTGNLGLPLALFAFGTVGFDFAVVIFAIMAVLSFTIGVWIVSGGGSPISAIKEPMVWATILGGIFLINDWMLPTWSVNTLDLIGQIAIPVMLITLGVAIARLKPGTFARALWLSTAKYAVCIAVPIAVGMFFALPPIAFAVLILQVSTPVAVTSYMLAEKYNADADQVAGLAMVSTLMSIIVIPVLLAFLI